MMSSLSLASARLRKLWIPFENNVLDGALCKNVLFPYFLYFFWVLNMILSHALILHVSQLHTQQVMTSKIRSHKIFNTYLLYFCTHFLVEIDEKSSHNGGFKYDLMMITDNGLLFGPPCIHKNIHTHTHIKKVRVGRGPASGHFSVTKHD